MYMYKLTMNQVLKQSQINKGLSVAHWLRSARCLNASQCGLTSSLWLSAVLRGIGKY